jgi:hypothetical protein
MRTISASLILLALFAAEPAFAGCGSHGAYTSRAPRTIVVKKFVQKRVVRSSVRTTSATVVKPQTKQSASIAGTTVAEEAPAKTVQSGAAQECKDYSPAVGEMITVPCS